MWATHVCALCIIGRRICRWTNFFFSPLRSCGQILSQTGLGASLQLQGKGWSWGHRTLLAGFRLVLVKDTGLPRVVWLNKEHRMVSVAKWILYFLYLEWGSILWNRRYTRVYTLASTKKKIKVIWPLFWQIWQKSRVNGLIQINFSVWGVNFIVQGFLDKEIRKDIRYYVTIPTLLQCYWIVIVPLFLKTHRQNDKKKLRKQIPRVRFLKFHF